MIWYTCFYTGVTIHVVDLGPRQLNWYSVLLYINDICQTYDMFHITRYNTSVHVPYLNTVVLRTIASKHTLSMTSDNDMSRIQIQITNLMFSVEYLFTLGSNVNMQYVVTRCLHYIIVLRHISIIHAYQLKIIKCSDNCKLTFCKHEGFISIPIWNTSMWLLHVTTKNKEVAMGPDILRFLWHEIQKYK